MPRDVDEDEPRDSLGEHELPDEADMDDPDAPDVDDCPYCGKSIHDEAEWCHHCGKYLSREDAPRRIPLWVVAAAVFAALAVLMWAI
jgi:hypothetical protein